MTQETINSRAAALENAVDNDVVDYVRAVFEQVNRNQQGWGSANGKTITKLQERVKALEVEVKNLKARL